MPVLIKLSHNGLKGYLGKGSGEWACLVEKERAARLVTKVYSGQLFYGTEDDWWMTVGTEGSTGTAMSVSTPGATRAGPTGAMTRTPSVSTPSTATGRWRLTVQVRRLHLLLGSGRLRRRGRRVRDRVVASAARLDGDPVRRVVAPDQPPASRRQAVSTPSGAIEPGQPSRPRPHGTNANRQSSKELGWIQWHAKTVYAGLGGNAHCIDPRSAVHPCWRRAIAPLVVAASPSAWRTSSLTVMSIVRGSAACQVGDGTNVGGGYR